jgi:hypothetical protein
LVAFFSFAAFGMVGVLAVDDSASNPPFPLPVALIRSRIVSPEECGGECGGTSVASLLSVSVDPWVWGGVDSGRLLKQEWKKRRIMLAGEGAASRAVIWEGKKIKKTKQNKKRKERYPRLIRRNE